jgi:ADP-ribose pyrophosphatase
MKDMEHNLIRYLQLLNERPLEFLASNMLNIITDPDVLQDFEQSSGRLLGVVYESHYHIMVVDLVEDNSGRRFAYERILAPNPTGAVVLVPI